jgi:hypothetical protein
MDNIKMDLQEVGMEGGMDWIDLAKGRDSCKSDNKPSRSIQCGEFLD